jgi:hypothetical protein
LSTQHTETIPTHNPAQTIRVEESAGSYKETLVTDQHKLSPDQLHEQIDKVQAKLSRDQQMLDKSSFSWKEVYRQQVDEDQRNLELLKKALTDSAKHPSESAPPISSVVETHAPVAEPVHEKVIPPTVNHVENIPVATDADQSFIREIEKETTFGPSADGKSMEMHMHLQGNLFKFLGPMEKEMFVADVARTAQENSFIKTGNFADVGTIHAELAQVFVLSKMKGDPTYFNSLTPPEQQLLASSLKEMLKSVTKKYGENIFQQKSTS